MTPTDAILVVLPNWVGDAVMSTPSLRAIRNHYQERRIILAGVQNVLETVFSPEFADDTLTVTGGVWSVAARIKKAGCGTAFIFPNSFRSALMVYLGRVGRRAGYARDGRSWLLTDRVPVKRSPDGRIKIYPTLDYYIDLMQALSIDVTDRKMVLFADSVPASNELRDPAVKATNGPMIMLNPGGAYGPAKLWAPEKYAALADLLIERFDAGIIINAAPSEKSIAVRVADFMKHKPLLNYGTRENSISIVKSLLSQCDLLVTNDTGARHMAVALDTAVVTVYGSTDPARTTLDYDKQQDIWIETECGPCQKKICPLPADKGYMQCLEGVSVDMVYDASIELLNTNSGGDA